MNASQYRVAWMCPEGRVVSAEDKTTAEALHNAGRRAYERYDIPLYAVDVPALQAECERLQRELESAHRAQRIAENELSQQMARAAIDTDSLRRQRNTLQADADRLEFLAEHPKDASIRIGTEFRTCVMWGISAAPGMDLRTAIDLAKKAGGQ